ncbi:WD40 repeat-like protein [Athelia psychrophila]|uniref:WD40 repeat-like protein n=1 Tax=Athelia psychrophila TaxID=1759441 RepID=A0A166LYW9_9AGAM|nr:WD40 repeat-like protein [Fibularhizoctonia sp. CBS 109695]
MKTGAMIGTLHQRGLASLTFLSNTKLACGSASKGTITIIDVNSGSRLLGPLEGQRAKIVAMHASPDGAQLSTLGEDLSLFIWNGISGALKSTTQTGSHDYILEGHQAAVCCIAFSADGSRLVSGSEDRSICLWALPDGAKLVVADPLAADLLVAKLVIPDAHEDPVAAVSFSSDGKTILSTSCANLAHIWDASTGIRLATISIPPTKTLAEGFPRAAFSQDGQRVVSCDGGGEDMRIWNAFTGAQILGPLEKLGFGWRKSPSVGFSADGSKVYMKADQSPRYEWDTTSGALLDGSRPDSFSGDALDPLVMDMAGRWIVDADTEQPLSGLPLDVPTVLTTASCKSAIAIVTKDQKLFVLHFPTRTCE